MVAAGALDTTAPSSRGERICDMMATEILAQVGGIEAPWEECLIRDDG